MTFLSILIGKITMWLLRLTGRTGSALPGLVVDRTNPNMLQRTLGQLPYGVIIISGTNGKTTTTKILACLLEAQGLRVLTNKTGSNFVRGIVSTIVQHAHLSGKLDYDIAVFEQDEAYAVHLAKRIRPRGVVALNVMRDQMDRFGEIDTTSKLLQQLVTSATDWVILNANDERISKLQPSEGVKTFWYAHSPALQTDFLTDDQLYDADKAVYHCEAKPYAELEAYGDGTVTLKLDGKKHRYDYELGGSHNAINIAAALTALHAAYPAEDITKTAQAVTKLEPAFGRGEVFKLADETEVTLQLIKNPAGFTHALRLLDVKKYGVTGIVINDEYADGRDVSWLWDINFEAMQTDAKTVLTGGTRAADMAVRLKYDLVPTQAVIPDLAQFVVELNKIGKDSGGRVMLFCTYTAMLELRELYKRYSNEVYEVVV